MCVECVFVCVCVYEYFVFGSRSQMLALALAHSCVLSASVTQGAYPVHNIDWVYGVLTSIGASTTE